MHRNKNTNQLRTHAGRRLSWIVILAVAAVAQLAAQETVPRLLTLDEAVRMAIAGNRSLQIAGLEISTAKLDVAQTKTKRLPAFSSTVLGSELLNEVPFTFKEGAFGTFPSTGPIPNKDTKITTPQRPTALVVSQVTQPLSQLYKIHLGIRAQELGTQVASEKARAQRLAVIRDVKQAYYAVLQTQSALGVAEAKVKQYQELDRVVRQRLSQEAALKSDSLDVKAKLAHEQYSIVQLQNTLDTRKEYLNDLLGRDVRTEFTVEQVPAASFEEIELKMAQDKALSLRPEIKQAELTVTQAEYSRRMAKADYIPEIGVAFNYLSPFNVDVLPKNVTSIGLELKWEPWDWGRRKDAVNQKKIAETAAQVQLHDAQSKVLLDVNNRFRKLSESRALIHVAEAAADAADEHMREVTNRYGQQAVLLTDVLKQQAATASAHDDYQQAVLGFWTAKSDFEKAMGEDQ
jgi:outer membrane protein